MIKKLLLMFVVAAGLCAAQTIVAGDGCFKSGFIWNSANDPAMATAPFPALEWTSGPLTCTVPVASGMTAVSVSLMEPNKTGPGQRVFTVTVNGMQSAPIDLFALTGGKLIVYEYDTPLFVAAGEVTITVKASIGNPVVSQIKILPQPAPVAIASMDPLDPSFSPATDTNPAHYPANVWITGPLAKVQQTTGAPGTDHWAQVHAMKNEIQSFQVHVASPASGVAALNVTMSDLVNARTGDKISASSTDIVVYRDLYMHVAPLPTAVGPTFLLTNPANAFLPDALLPAVDPYYHQTTGAFPFAVAPGQNQSMWIDVHVPPGVPSGYYSGTVVVRDGAAMMASMPVVYAVWDWLMPSTSSLPSMTSNTYAGFAVQAYGSVAGGAAYPGSQGSSDFGATLANVDLAVQMLDNRYSLGSTTNVFPGTGDFGTFDSVYGPLLGGTTAHVPGILKGARLTSWDIIVLPTLGQFVPATFQNFYDHFKAKGWIAPSYSLVDEPDPTNPAVWAKMNADAAVVHGSNPPVTAFATTDLTLATKNNVLGAVDRLVVNLVSLEHDPQHLADLASYHAWLAGSPARQFWSYQACSSADTCGNGAVGPCCAGSDMSTYPNYNVDGTPVANRTMEWVTYLHGQTGELYYYVDVCASGGVATNCGTFQGQPPSPLDPLKSNYYSGGWGDGTLMYAASSAVTGTPIPLWLPSMRMKMIRDGMQDYEYMVALGALGKRVVADAAVASVVTNSYTFTSDPAALEHARTTMGTAIHQAVQH